MVDTLLFIILVVTTDDDKSLITSLLLKSFIDNDVSNDDKFSKVSSIIAVELFELEGLV